MSKKNLYVFRIFQILYAVFLLVLIVKDLCLGSYDKNAFADVLNACDAVGYNRGYKEALEKVKSLLLENVLGGVNIEE